MTEINIILNTQFENLDEEITKNDKELYFEELNNELQLYKYNSYNKYNIEYNQIKEDFLYNDNLIDYINEIENINIDIKKLLIKKLLIFFNPIILEDELKNNQSKLIIKANSISVNYPINSKVILTKSKKLINRIINSNFQIIINGLFNLKYYNNNLSYKLNNYKFINQFIINKLSKEFKQDILISLTKLKYLNTSTFNNNDISNKDLQFLYKLYLNCTNLYFDNYFLQNNKSILFYDINKFNKLSVFINKTLVDKNYNNYITKFNTFLSYKINNNFNNHTYFAFESSELLNLYEQILIYSIDDKNVKNQINNILETQKNKKIYKENQKILNEYNLKLIHLELLTKKKFPNLFNPNSKDFMFYSYKTFNLDDLPKKYKDIILIEYKKLQNYRDEYLKNKCKHKTLVKELFYSNNKYSIVDQINKLIKNTNNENDFYKCIICSFNLICPHITEYYNQLFDKKKKKETTEFSIRQHIINKYMSNSKINMIYYCKICGEELGKSLDLEQDILYKDNIKLNTSEYSDKTSELVLNNINYIIYNFIVFTELNLSISKKYLITYVNNTILFYINNLEKSLRKSKLYNEDKISLLLNFNSIIFIYATLIFIMTKYPFINFNQNKIKTGRKEFSNIIIQKQKKSIIIPKKTNINNNKDLLSLIKYRFKDAFNLIVSSNNILLNKLNYLKNIDKIKEVLLKTYGIIAKNDQINIIDKILLNINNSSLLMTSNIYSYFYFIKKTYPLNKKISSYNSSIFKNYNIYENNNNKLKFTDFDIILNKKNINFKHDYLFDSFTSDIITDISKFSKIDDYNTYKLMSFNLFNYHLHHNLYNLPIFDIINNIQNKDIELKKNILDNLYLDSFNLINKDNKEYNNYKNYINACQIIKQYEISLINENIMFNIYPYSFIKLNNKRYYYNKEINLNIYYCLKDGFIHNYGIYIFKLNDKEIEINKKELDKFISNISINDKLIFIDYKCTKCLELKSKLYNTKNYDNAKITNLIKQINDVNGFFNLYLNICPIISNYDSYQFHNFINKNSEYICNICNINYKDLINKNIDIYYKYTKEYEDYKNNKINKINVHLNKFNDDKLKLSKININETFKNDNLQKYINKINNLILDNLIINLSKKYNIDIIYLQKLGLTEGYKYEEIDKINISYKNIDNRLTKLNGYLRSLMIYLNLLKNNKIINSYFEEDLFIILNEYKDINSKLYKELPEYDINLSDLLINLKISNDNKIIIDFYLKAIINFILELDDINNSKFNNKLYKFINFIIHKIIKFDELFSNFNYSKLKQMFTEDKFDINLEFDKNEEYENEDDDDLFGYNDLNINFEDEDPDDN